MHNDRHKVLFTFGRTSVPLAVDSCRKANINQTPNTTTVKEPTVKDSDVKGEGDLRLDWSMRVFWEQQREALFDCHIFNGDTICDANTPIDTLPEKKKQSSIDTRDAM